MKREWKTNGCLQIPLTVATDVVHETNVTFENCVPYFEKILCEVVDNAYL